MKKEGSPLTQRLQHALKISKQGCPLFSKPCLSWRHLLGEEGCPLLSKISLGLLPKVGTNYRVLVGDSDSEDSNDKLLNCSHRLREKIVGATIFAFSTAFIDRTIYPFAASTISNKRFVAILYSFSPSLSGLNRSA